MMASLSVSSSSPHSPQIPLSFILECFHIPLTKFINIKDLGPKLISQQLISAEEFEKVLKTLQTETSTDTASHLFEIILKKNISDKKDLDDGRKFMLALQSGVPPHRILAHYIQGIIPGIPAESEEEQRFREKLTENIVRLTKALDSPDLIREFFQHTGEEEGQRLWKEQDLRYFRVFLMLERSPGPIKPTLLKFLKKEPGFASIVQYLEDKSRLPEKDQMEIDDEDVRSFCGGFDSMGLDNGDMAGCPPERLNSHDERFLSEEVTSSTMDYKSNIDDGEPPLKIQNTSSGMDTGDPKAKFSSMDYKSNIDDGESSLKTHISSSKMETTESEEMNRSPAVHSPKGGMDLRPYQRELLSSAREGYNTVILAPTNSGKTFVAGQIIQLHFSHSRREKPKVAFIVEKKALADQQELSIKSFLDQGSPGHSNLQIGKVTGDTEVPDLDMLIDQNDVIVMTAGVLCSDHRAVTDQQISVSTFSLIFFDECHHCEKSHAYNRLMRLYRQEKKESLDLGLSNQLPQIVGLTATLGTGKGGNTVDKAVEHALTVLANLNADKIQTVNVEKESLAEHVSIPKEMSPVYVERREVDPVADIITELMIENEEMLKKLPDYGLIPPVPNVRLRDMKDYEQWVITAKEKHCPEKVGNGDNRKRLVVCLEHLAVYHRALCVNRDARCKDACGFMREKLDHLWSDRESLIEEQWQSQRIFYAKIKEMDRLAKKREYSNPLLIELEQLILKEFRAKPASRALLFTQTIDSTLYIEQWIKESPMMNEKIKPCRMTRETSEPQRKALIDKFKSGEYNFMIVTSVVEEGIDIGTCNLVYRLNYVPSGCGRIQQKGRIRAENGQSYFVCYGDLKQNELLTKMMEELMAKAVHKINQLSEEELQKRLERFQRKDARMLAEESRRRRLQQQGRDSKEYLFCCKRCNTEACKSSDIKRYNKSQHYVCSQEFCDDKIDIKPHPKPKKIDDMYKIGKVYCRECGSEWGILAKLEESRFPVLKIDPFVIYELLDDDSRGRPKVVKKWIQAPFTVEDVDEVTEDLTYDIDFESWA